MKTEPTETEGQTGTPLPNPSPAPEVSPQGKIESRESDKEAIARLSALSPLEYDRTRKQEAKKLGVQVSTLDALIKEARKPVAGIAHDMADTEPWPDPVDGAALLTEIALTVRRFIVCHHTTAEAVALWVAKTWFIDYVQVAPLAVITAPEKRCGKSLLLAIIGKLSCRPIMTSNFSPAALFRAIDAWHPTLLIDESDAFLKEKEELRGILNAGHTRESAYVVRTVGEDFTPTRFNVWGAKAIAGIGHLPDTIMDRAINLELKRKQPTEKVDRLRHAESDLFKTLAAKLARFAEDNAETVRHARPELPESLHDRAQDNWEPLLAIADIAGGPWPELAKKAALYISRAEAPQQSVGTELLADIQEIFEQNGEDRISTASLIKALCEDEEKRWATFNRGHQITPRQISAKLKGYGILSKTIRIGYGDTPKGFMLDQFKEAFSRYLADTTATGATPPPVNDDVEKPVADCKTRKGR